MPLVDLVPRVDHVTPDARPSRRGRRAVEPGEPMGATSGRARYEWEWSRAAPAAGHAYRPRPVRSTRTPRRATTAAVARATRAAVPATSGGVVRTGPTPPARFGRGPSGAARRLPGPHQHPRGGRQPRGGPSTGPRTACWWPRASRSCGGGAGPWFHWGVALTVSVLWYGIGYPNGPVIVPLLLGVLGVSNTGPCGRRWSPRPVRSLVVATMVGVSTGRRLGDADRLRLDARHARRGPDEPGDSGAGAAAGLAGVGGRAGARGGGDPSAGTRTRSACASHARSTTWCPTTSR